METLQPHLGPRVAGDCLSGAQLHGLCRPEHSQLFSAVVCCMSGSELPTEASRMWLGDNRTVLVCVRAWGTRWQRVLVFCVCFLWDKPGREDPSVSVVWMGPRAHPWCLLGTGVIVLSGVTAW